MSDIARRANDRKPKVVARTAAATSPARREKKSVPSVIVRARQPAAASAETARAGPSETPKILKAPAISQ